METVTDQRFARLHTDPRFQRVPKKDRKVQVDRRFSAMFTDKAFREEAPVDRYGRKQQKHKKPAADDTLRRVFELEPERATVATAATRQPRGDAVVKRPSKRKADRPKLKPSAQRTREAKPVACNGNGPTRRETGGDEAASGRNVKKLKGTAAERRPKPTAARGKARPARSPEPLEEEPQYAANYDEDEDAEEEEEGASEADGEDEAEENAGVEESETSEAETTEDEDEDEQGATAAEVDSALLEWVERENAVPRVKDATHRLAVVSLDWDQVRAVDLLAVLRSFLPAGGRILSVAVYLSDFGVEQLAREAVSGPTSIWKDQDGVGAGANGADEEEDEGTGIDNEKLRKYELSRLNYYYGVVRCDSAKTAGHIYENCDGAEFESSAMVLDLRFIPDDMEFTRDPRDKATELPPKYISPSFMCSALQQSNVKLSWDDDDASRQQVMKRDFSKSEVREMEYAAYLASSSESDEGEEEYPFEAAAPPPRKDARDSRRKQLVGESNDIEAGVTREFTFIPSLEAKTRSTARKRAAGEEDGPTVWEQAQLDFHRKRKERRERKRQAEAQEHAAADDAASTEDDVPTDSRHMEADEDDDLDEAALRSDPFFAEALEEQEREDAEARGRKGRAGSDECSGMGKSRTNARARDAKASKAGRKGRTKGKKFTMQQSPEEAERAAQEEAELKLLMMGEDEHTLRGYDLKKLALKRDKKGARQRKQSAVSGEPAENADADGFKLDLNDSRFQRVFTSYDFAVDPTDPKFKLTQGSQQLLQEISKRHTGLGEKAPAASSDVVCSALSTDPSLARLVSAVKTKTPRVVAKVQASSSVPSASALRKKLRQA